MKTKNVTVRLTEEDHRRLLEDHLKYCQTIGKAISIAEYIRIKLFGGSA